MPLKLRLQRHGKKSSPFYHIVAADSRAPRDGKFVEKVGTYNPNVNPAIIDLNFERALHWLTVGAQPTDTCRAILSYRGVMYMNHLNKGVLKGAMTPEQAQAKFDKWMEAKNAEVAAKVSGLDKAQRDADAASLKAETEIKEKRAAEYAAKNAELAAEAAKAQAEAAAAAVTETPADQSAEETTEA
ncbi:MAG: small subunit ribosomal protein S16 [Salibacteraceae bacterium]|jgi:small subunit ribosomal protein S16